MLQCPVAAVGAPYYLSGNDLYRRCQGIGYEQGVCDGIVLGVLDEWLTWRQAEHAAVCLPVKVDARQLQDVVFNYLKDHSNERDLPAGTLVVRAVTEAWDCK
jgi:hypothetical protein